MHLFNQIVETKANLITRPVVRNILVLLIGLSCFSIPATAQKITRYAVLVGIGQYPAKSGWSEINGDADVTDMAAALEKKGFLPGNITRIVNEEATVEQILLAFRALSQKVQAGDVVYVHFSGHFQQFTDRNGDEADGFDEAFVTYDVSTLTNETPASAIQVLTDDLLARSLELVQNKLSSVGCLVLVFDGGMGDESQNPSKGLRGNKGPFYFNSPKNGFRGTQASALAGCDLIDRAIDPSVSRTVLIDRGKDIKPVNETMFQSRLHGPVTTAMLTILDSSITVKTFEALQQTFTRMYPTGNKTPDIRVMGNLDEPFFHEKPGVREIRDFALRQPITTQLNGKGKVYGVCIGVSEYGGNFRPLTYAHSDAVTFYNYLKNCFKGRFVNDSTLLLINERATSSRVFESLKQLNQILMPEDMVYFFFAGHGDVEGDLISKPGFLLLKDGPEFAYGAGGHIPMTELKYYLGNYVFKGAKVFLVVDACRSGTIAGGREGSGETLMSLQNLDDAAIKVLACHPNENSREGVEFGGGFGAFTFYMMRGLSGSANQDQNSSVINVEEMGQFLADSVGKATGFAQNPLIEGPPKQAFLPVLNGMDPSLLKKMPDWLQKSGEVRSKIESDSELVQTERKFYQQIRKKNFAEPKGSSAYEWLVSLEKRCQEKEWTAKPVWRSDFTEGVVTKSQLVINQYISGNDGAIKDTAFGLCARELGLALDFKSPNDVLYLPLLARQYFFKARSISPQKIDNDLQRRNLAGAIRNLYSSIRIEGNAGHHYNALGRLYALNRQYDSALIMYRTAAQIAPRWKFPYNNMGSAFFEKGKALRSRPLIDSSIRYYSYALQLDPKFGVALNNSGKAFQALGEISSAKKAFQRAVFIQPKLGDAYHSLGNIYREEQNWDSAYSVLYQGVAVVPGNADLLVDLGNCHFDQSQEFSGSGKDSLLQAAKTYFLASQTILPEYVFSSIGLSNVYWDLKDYDSSAYFAGVAVKLDTTNADYTHYQIDALMKSVHWQEAINVLKLMDKRFPTDALHFLKWGYYYFKKKNPEKSLQYFKQARKSGLTKMDFESLDEWTLLRNESWFSTWFKSW